MIAGHAGPDTMIWIADQGRGRFYNVTSPNDLPQIFIKEAAVILKSAIYEEPFKPQLQSSSELVRGIGAGEYPTLLGYVATTPKPRAEIPLVTDKGDPLLAHWQFGLGRAVAFTSDAKAKWSKNWLGWGEVPAILVADRAMEFAAAGELGFHDGCERGRRRGADQRGGAG